MFDVRLLANLIDFLFSDLPPENETNGYVFIHAEGGLNQQRIAVSIFHAYFPFSSFQCPTMVNMQTAAVLFISHFGRLSYAL